MAGLCSRCASYDLSDILSNDFCQYARALTLLNGLEDDLDDVIQDASPIGRQREGILEDTKIDAAHNDEFLQTLFARFNVPSGQHEILQPRLVEEVFAPLNSNRFALNLGTLASLTARASECELCVIFADKRIWRFRATDNGDETVADNDYEPASTNLCFLLPMWPEYKVMWHDYYETPNELYVLITESEDDSPPEIIDDCFWDVTRDLRTICLFNQSVGIWRQIPQIVDLDYIRRKWLPPFETNRSSFEELGLPSSKFFMLIDVVRRRIIHVPTLIDVQYAALSYVWGAARTSEKWCQDIQTKHDSGSKSIALDIDALPRTICDVFEICEKLAIPYMWIDSLCIAQNQVSLKADAIADMGHVYRGSHLCIVAAADVSVYESLPGVLSPRTSRLVQVADNTIGITPPPLRETVRDSKWNSRGWCFQESTLAPRSLVVLKDQVFLQSGRSLLCEAVGVDVGNNYDAPEQDYKEEPLTILALYDDTSQGAAFSVYKDMVANYSSRELSFEADAEDAFKGLALALEKRFQIRFYKGLPIQHFVQALNWFCINAITRNKVYSKSRRRVNANGQPFAASWSWLSRVGAVSHTSIPPSNNVYIADAWQNLQLANTPDLPADGFETEFANVSFAHPMFTRKIQSPVLVRTNIYHATKVKLMIRDLSVEQWLDNITQHRYILDSGDRTSLVGTPFVIPLVYKLGEEHELGQKAPESGDLLRAALLVELFHYPYAVPDAAGHLQVGTDQSLQAAQVVTNDLSAVNKQNRVFLARRVGIIPYGLADLKIYTNEDVATYIVLA